MDLGRPSPLIQPGGRSDEVTQASSPYVAKLPHLGYGIVVVAECIPISGSQKEEKGGREKEWRRSEEGKEKQNLDTDLNRSSFRPAGFPHPADGVRGTDQ